MNFLLLLTIAFVTAGSANSIMETETRFDVQTINYDCPLKSTGYVRVEILGFWKLYSTLSIYECNPVNNQSSIILEMIQYVSLVTNGELHGVLPGFVDRLDDKGDFFIPRTQSGEMKTLLDISGPCGWFYCGFSSGSKLTMKYKDGTTEMMADGDVKHRSSNIKRETILGLVKSFGDNHVITKVLSDGNYINPSSLTKLK